MAVCHRGTGVLAWAGVVMASPSHWTGKDVRCRNRSITLQGPSMQAPDVSGRLDGPLTAGAACYMVRNPGVAALKLLETTCPPVVGAVVLGHDDLLQRAFAR
jgi:hypothetical protein